jgi:hypothetical protein
MAYTLNIAERASRGSIRENTIISSPINEDHLADAIGVALIAIKLSANPGEVAWVLNSDGALVWFNTYEEAERNA